MAGNKLYDVMHGGREHGGRHTLSDGFGQGHSHAAHSVRVTVGVGMMASTQA